MQAANLHTFTDPALEQLQLAADIGWPELSAIKLEPRSADTRALAGQVEAGSEQIYGRPI